MRESKSKKNVLRKLMAFLLVLGMCTTMIPEMAFAADISEAAPQEQQNASDVPVSGTETSGDAEKSEVNGDQTEQPNVEDGALKEENQESSKEEGKTDSKDEDKEAVKGQDEQTESEKTDEQKDAEANQASEKSEINAQAEEPESRVTATLPEGTYYISTGNQMRQVLDVAGGSKGNQANVQLYGTNVSAAQQWKISYDSNGYATIKNVGSGKVLDVSGGKAANSQNVQQYTENGTKAQKWNIEQTASGYKIASALSKNYVLDCAGGNSSNGTNIQIYTTNNSKAQRFEFTKVNVTPASGTQAVEDGVYSIYPQNASGKCLDVNGGSASNGANVQIYSANGTQAQSFQFTYDSGTACYSIVNVLSGLALDADCGNPINGTNVHMWSRNKDNAQKWAVTKAADGTLTIINRASGTSLDIAGGASGNGTNVQMYQWNQSKAQKFTLKTAKVLSDGIYSIATCLNFGQVADVPNASTSAGTQMQLYKGNATPAQKYVVHCVEGNTYTIGVIASGMYLTGESGKVVQRASNGNDSQKWILTLNGSGLTIKNKATGTVIDCTGGNSGNGTRLQLYAANGTTAQRFRFFSTPAVNSGLYEISSGLNQKRRVDVAGGSSASGANIQLWDANGTNSQKFWFTSVGDNVYRITNAKTGKALDVKNGSTANGANVQQWDVNGNNAQNWKAVVTNSGWYTFVNMASGKNLDISGGRNANGANIQSYAGNGSVAQCWHLIPTTKAVEDAVLDRAEKKAVSTYSATNYLILVDLTSHRTMIFEGRQGNWKNIRNWNCSTGAPESPTVVGEYTVGIKGYSFGHGYTCYYYTQFWGDYLFHSVPYNEGTFDVQDGRIGESVSQGCVRLDINNAIWIYNNIPSGTKVITYY